MIRMIMSDLDGTLLRNDKTVSAETIQAIKKARELGILFGVATGRSLVAVKELIHKWGIAPYCDVLIGMNGSQFLDVKTQEMKVVHQLEGHIILDIINRCKHLDVNFGLYDEDVLYVWRDDEQARSLAKRNGFHLMVTDFVELAKRPQSKLLILTKPDYMPVVEEFAMSLPTDLYRGFKSDNTLFEFVHPLVSKSFGIQQVCEHFGFSMENVMTFGDNDNDIEMIRDAGIGVCMSNGTEKAKAVASAVTLSNEEDGLAKFVNDYIANQCVHS